MLTKQPVRRNRRLIRIILVTTGIVVLLVLGLHIWFVNNARHLMMDMVASKSKGKLKLELSHLRFDFLGNKLQVREAELISTDSLTASTTYHVKFRKLTLKTSSFWSLLFRKRLALDSIKLHDPEVGITQWRRDTGSRVKGNELSISQQMGKLYNSMLDGLETFGIRRIVVNNAKLTLLNKLDPGSKPSTITNIYFSLFRTARETKKRDEFIPEQQTVDLATTNQDIALPGGRHRLSFKNFKLQLFNKRIQMDSCTLTAISNDSAKSSYKIFFHKLLLVGVDFDAMYRYNLIKADSVYCENPLFDISLVTTTGGPKKEKPDPGRIINELTGDLDLAFVGVKDAGIHINISGRKKRSLFNSNKDDFEMRGLRINADSSQPVQVARFNMLVRDYHLYNEDSSTAYTFDSIQFQNNRIVLNNFSVITRSEQNRSRNERDFRIPYFQLTGLDWYQLIFEENLVAREAVLYNPVIFYTKKVSSGPKKKTNIFQSLQTLDDLITLNKISVINGQINMKLGPSLSLSLHEANLNLFSDRLLGSTNNEGLRRAIEKFSFTKALLKFKDITATIDKAMYTGTNLLRAENMTISSKRNDINASIQGVVINNLLADESSETMMLDGLSWNRADIRINKPAMAAGKPGSGSSELRFQNISGKNTKLRFSGGGKAVATSIRNLQVGAIVKPKKGALRIEGLKVEGTDLSLKSKDLNIGASAYRLSGSGPSALSSLSVSQINKRDTMSIKIPQLFFTADINELLNGDLHLSNLEASQARVRIHNWNAPKTAAEKTAPPNLRIDRIQLTEPDIIFTANRDDSATTFLLPGAAGSRLSAAGLSLEKDVFKLASLSINTTSATLSKRNGDLVGVEKGMVDLELSNMYLSSRNGKPYWTALVNSIHLKNPRSFSLGKNKNQLSFRETSLGNLSLSSEFATDFHKLLKFNISAWLRTTTGEYIDSAVTLKWHNAAYNAAAQLLSVDSFVYHPTQLRDSAMATAKHQMDYITLLTGPVRMRGFDLDKYEQDSSLIAEALEISRPQITIFRDKKPPFSGGVEKLLPVDMIRSIPLPVSVNKLVLADGTLSYTEKHAKTRAEGTITLNRLEAELTHIRNRGLSAADSLGLTLNAYLMDSALIRLNVQESYLDTLSGFLMTLKLKPTSLSFLNPVLVPLSNVMIRSGTIDSFQLSAVGNKHLAIGEMQMFYHDLRIQLVKGGDETRSSFMTKVASFLANTFVIKKNNNGRTGVVYFERLKDRSFFNYIVKMTFSGMATSIGVKKNRSYLKKYNERISKK